MKWRKHTKAAWYGCWTVLTFLWTESMLAPGALVPLIKSRD